jgi:hypothetical protein
MKMYQTSFRCYKVTECWIRQIYILIKPEVCFIRIVYSGYGGGLNQLLMFWFCLMYLLL